jgi:hypothetical protein
MVNSQTLKIQPLPLHLAFYLLFLLFFFCPKLWASQDAMVITDRAMIYSDRDMTSPIGYVKRGKKLVVGEIPRNKAQVYPIVVSGKVAYIRVLDVTTEKESMDSTRLVAERFQKNTDKIYKSKFVLGYFAFSSQANLNAENTTDLLDKDALLWHGLSIKGEVLLKDSFDFQVIANFMATSEGQEKYRVIEFGLGAAYRLIDSRKFILRLEGQGYGIPFSSYEIGSDFRLTSYGYTVGGGLNMTYLFDRHWGFEASGGVYYTKLLGYDTPAPYEDVSPSFVGNRFGLGVNYTY